MTYLNRRHITNLLSRWFGGFASRPHAPFWQKLINRGYVKLMGLDMSEFHHPNDYPTLNALFTRTLVIPRELEGGKKAIVSPCDAYVTACGKVENDTLFQIKGMPYSLKRLIDGVGPETFGAVKEGMYMNLYLSPSDYHRYHAPCDLRVLRRIHIPGRLYPVNFRFLRKTIDLFLQNERVVLECRDGEGRPMVLVYVGALNVGQMAFTFPPDAPTNTLQGKPMEFGYDDLRIQKGDDMGCFKMGSTIVMLTPADHARFDVCTGDHVRFGQKIGKFLD